jgi:hypothetical protein
MLLTQMNNSFRIKILGTLIVSLLVCSPADARQSRVATPSGTNAKAPAAKAVKAPAVKAVKPPAVKTPVAVSTTKTPAVTTSKKIAPVVAPVVAPKPAVATVATTAVIAPAKPADSKTVVGTTQAGKTSTTAVATIARPTTTSTAVDAIAVATTGPTSSTTATAAPLPLSSNQIAKAVAALADGTITAANFTALLAGGGTAPNGTDLTASLAAASAASTSTGVQPPSGSVSSNVGLFYWKVEVGNCGNLIVNTPIESFSGWGTDFVSAWQGDYVGSDSNERAFGSFEYNPANPLISSPWHNALYESTIDGFEWGARNFLLNFLWGNCNPMQFDQSNLTNSKYQCFLGLYFWKQDFTSTVDKSTSPARWKGMKESIRSLLEGTLNPTAASRKQKPINQPCNLVLYLQGCRGYESYRKNTSKIWDEGVPGGTSEEKDIEFYRKLDDVIADIVSMKRLTDSAGNPIVSGRLSVCLDTAANSATQTDLSVFRTSTHYRSDKLELADWYVKTKLENGGVEVFYESKGEKVRNVTRIEGAVNASGSGVLKANQWASVPFCGDDYNLWFTDPNNRADTTGSFVNWVSNNDVPNILRVDTATFPQYFEFKSADVFNALRSVKVGLAERDLGNQFGSACLTCKSASGWLNNLYTPQYSVFQLYTWSDHLRFYDNKFAANNLYKRVKLNTPNYMVVSPFAVSSGKVMLAKWTSDFNYAITHYWRMDSAAVKNSAYGNNFFSPASFAAAPMDYAGTYWTPQGLAFYDSNIRQPSLAAFVAMLRNFNLKNAPPLNPNEPNDGFAGNVYPNDDFACGIITNAVNDSINCQR